MIAGFATAKVRDPLSAFHLFRWLALLFGFLTSPTHAKTLGKGPEEAWRVNTTDTAPDTTDSYTLTPGTNRLASISTAYLTRNLIYDNRGNLSTETRGPAVTATTDYDGHGRLIGYTRTSEDSLSHSYNGLDDRTATVRTPSGGGNADIRRFVTAPDGRAMGEYDNSASDVRAEFIWMSPEVGDSGMFGGDDGTSGSGGGGYMPIALATAASGGGTTLNWVHGDHLGTPIVITDATGIAIPQPGGYTTPAFPGQSRTLYDLYYNRYRDYDPSTGRYIQADPIGLAGGQSPYSYAAANPVRYIDPTGEVIPLIIAGACAANPVACVAVIGGAAAAGIATYNYYFNMPDEYHLYPRIFGPSCPPALFYDGDGGGHRGGGGISIPRSGPKRDDYCFERWMKESGDCYKWSYLGSRAVAACRRRAEDRLTTCHRNSPTEPDVWDPIADWYGNEEYGPD